MFGVRVLDGVLPEAVAVVAGDSEEEEDESSSSSVSESERSKPSRLCAPPIAGNQWVENGVKQ